METNRKEEGFWTFLNPILLYPLQALENHQSLKKNEK